MDASSERDLEMERLAKDQAKYDEQSRRKTVYRNVFGKECPYQFLKGKFTLAILYLTSLKY
jgi:hypothetical protein